MLRVLVGMQWGDEGKGKALSARRADWCVRMNGGPNAGHTLAGIKVHQVPPGAVDPSTKLMIGPGSVVNISDLIDEVSRLRKDAGIDLSGRLFISGQAHVITSEHIVRDACEEAERDVTHIGTTRRGNGPVHADKYARIGRRVDSQSELASHLWEGHGVAVVNDASSLLNDALDRGQSMDLLVAHGTMLDIDHGTYPYVTSSHCTTAGAFVGTGISPTRLRSLNSEVIGVVKAYTTRVAPGPMRGEYDGVAAEAIREIGAEYGTTTGRPRRIAPLDLGQLEYAAKINGPDFLFLTKVDVLADWTTIQVVENDWSPSPFAVIRDLPGWSSTELRTPGVPAGLKTLIGLIEEACRARVSAVGVGPGPHDLLAGGFPSSRY